MPGGDQAAGALRSSKKQTPPRTTVVRISCRMQVACRHRALVSLYFPDHVQPLQGGHVTKHRSSPVHRSSPTDLSTHNRRALDLVLL